MTVFLGSANDDIFTSPVDEDDRLEGRGGNDSLSAGVGNDLLFGGAGRDTLRGGAERDTLFGGKGDDSLFGGAGNDILDGGDNNDVLYGGDGTDLLEGGNDSDVLFGGMGNDELSGEAGRDTLFGEAGRDDLYGGNGTDFIYAGDGNDDLSGDAGKDSIYGGRGADTLYIEAVGHIASGEVYHGNGGRDTLDVTDATLQNVTFDLRNVTLADLEVLDARTEGDLIVQLNAAQLNAGAFSDTLLLASSQDSAILEIHMDTPGTLDLTAFNFDIRGSAAEYVSVIGSTGADTIHDAATADTRIASGKGSDRIILTTTDAFVIAGGGNDRFDISGTGHSLFGGKGADTFAVLGEMANLIDGGAGTNDLIDLSGFTPDDPLLGVTVDFANDATSYDTTLGSASGFDIINVEHAIGSGGNDILVGDDLADNSLSGARGSDSLFGGDGNDTLFGGNGQDFLRGETDRDAVFGGGGDDTLRIFLSSELTSGETYNGGGGADTLSVGDNINSGNTNIFDLRDVTLRSIENLQINDPGAGENTNVILTASQIGDGLARDASVNMVRFSDVSATFDVRMGNSTSVDLSDMIFENVQENDRILIKGDSTAEDITGSQEQDIITSGKGADMLKGGDGADDLFGGDGTDTLKGGKDGDDLTGGRGADILTGGGGADFFDYTNVNQSGVGSGNRDVITDFNAGTEAIGLEFDADTVTAGLQNYDFIGTNSFTNSAGELRVKSAGGGQDTRVLLDSDGDGAADFEILLLGVTTGEIGDDTFFGLP